MTRLDDPVFEFQKGQKIFLYATTSTPPLAHRQPPI